MKNIGGIGFAISMMALGARVAREGWNGKGMFLYLVGPGNYPAASPAAKSFWGADALVPYRPYVAMKTVDDDVVPWLCSQSDLLAEDWFALDEELLPDAGDRLVEEAGPEAGFHPALPTAQIAMPEGFKEYVGVKRVFAQPMTRGDYNRLRGWDIPADEDPADDGYLLEYTDGGKPNVDGFEGYISWSPRDVFDRAYNPSD